MTAVCPAKCVNKVMQKHKYNHLHPHPDIQSKHTNCREHGRGLLDSDKLNSTAFQYGETNPPWRWFYRINLGKQAKRLKLLISFEDQPIPKIAIFPYMFVSNWLARKLTHWSWQQSWQLAANMLTNQRSVVLNKTLKRGKIKVPLS